ncbi:tetratricopeptide repeat protein [Actinomyces timonensis]|uniref:Tetratricopeptide repeat protein n=1 Tax=Actinomyces timonensis TaxID=1288391 RepID=A0AAU8N2C7_9ACTO
MAWIDASPAGDPVAGRPSGVEVGLAELAGELGIGDPSDPSARRARSLMDRLNSGGAADRLIVLDNLERADDLAGLRPRGRGLRVIVTTNLPGGALGESIPVGVFTRDQSVGFLRQRLARISEGDASAMAGVLGDLPVALSQAASTMEAMGWEPGEYMGCLEGRPLEEVVERWDGDGYPHEVWRALRLGYQTALEALGRRDEDLARLARLQLGMLSMMPHRGVPRDWLHRAGGGGPDAARRSLALLLERGVVLRAGDDAGRGGIVSLHRLQSRVVREDAVREGAVGGIVEAVVRALESALDGADMSDPGGAGRRTIVMVIESLSFLGDLDLGADLGDVDVEGLCGLVLLAGRRADEAGLGSFAVSLERIVDRVASLLGPDHPSALALRNNLAYAYESAGRLDEAIALFEQVLEDRLRVLGPDHPDTLTWRNNLAYAYESAGRLDEAIALLEQNLKESLRVLGPDHPDTLTSRNNLATAYQSAGRLDEAIALLEQNLKESLRVLGPEHPLTKRVAENLAICRRVRDERQPPPPDAVG